jgi:hypothetical protein
LAGWGSPLQDIAWIIWFLKFHYPHISDELSQIFINSYRDYSEFNFSSVTLKQYAVSRVMNIMQRIKNSNEEVKEEWIKRLSWTLSSDFTI